MFIEIRIKQYKWHKNHSLNKKIQNQLSFPLFQIACEMDRNRFQPYALINYPVSTGLEFMRGGPLWWT